MTRIQDLNRRYTASASLVRHGVEVIAVGDPAGARLNAATRRLVLAVREDGPGLWDDLVGAVTSLRWRLVVQPLPLEMNAVLRDVADQVALHVRRLRGAVATDVLLDELEAASAAVASADPPLATLLLRSVQEVGESECVVVAASRTAQAALDGWLGGAGIRVVTVGDLARAQLNVEQAYAVGPPRFFRSSLVTAPVTGTVSFFLPAWFGDRSIPCSAIAAYADGAIRVGARLFTEGDTSEPATNLPEAEVEEDDLLPQPVWGTRQSPDREPTSSEVEARKLLLSGNLALWLDDGERIRALDRQQPAGERVTYVEVGAVRAGTCLLLRSGETERRALYEAALTLLGSRRASVDVSQREWKARLQARLLKEGYREVVRELRSRGIKTADRARAWTGANLVRPHSDHDFQQLLLWLDLPIQPYFGHATMLRRALYQASADIREQLERAVSAADLSMLEREGHLSLDVQAAGFRGILATHVLAISPYTEIVSRHDARVPFKDWSGQWLE